MAVIVRHDTPSPHAVTLSAERLLRYLASHPGSMTVGHIATSLDTTPVLVAHDLRALQCAGFLEVAR